MECDYGCGREANHVMSNGKNCCEAHYSKCPSLREKNSNGLREAYSSGKRTPSAMVYEDLPENTKKKMNWRKGKFDYTHDDVFIKHSSFSTGYVKERILKEKLKEYKCKECEIVEWNGKEISLELDHINGKNRDNRLENLRFLCPNCHSQTETWRGRNINTGQVKVTDEVLIESLKRNDNIRQALLDVGLAAKGGNYARCKKLLKEI